MPYTLLVTLKGTGNKHFLYKKDWRKMIAEPVPDLRDKNAITLFLMKHKDMVRLYKNKKATSNIKNSLIFKDIEKIDVIELSDELLSPKFEKCPNCHSTKVIVTEFVKHENVYDFNSEEDTSTLVTKTGLTNDSYIDSYHCSSCNMNLNFFDFSDFTECLE